MSSRAGAFAFLLFALVIVWGSAPAAQALVPTPIAGFGGAGRLATGDLNGDGHDDLIGALGWAATNERVGIAISDGAGGFASIASYFSGPEPTAVAVADMNGDGRLDVVVTNSNRGSAGGSVAVLLGDGTGALGAPITYALDNTGAVATGAFTADDVPDVAVVHGMNLTLLANDGAGNLSHVSTVAVNPPGATRLASVAAADFDRDSKLDVAIVSYSHVFGNNTSLTTYRGNGDGTFGSRVAYTSNAQGAAYFSFSTQLTDIAVDDLNDDEYPDIVITSEGHTAFPLAAAAWVMLNNGAGGFPSPAKHPQPTGIVGVAIGDMNDDGNPDIVVADIRGGTVDQLFNDGSGAFGGAIRTNTAAHYVVLGDFNNSGAGTLDIVVSRGGADPAILLNGTSTPADSTPPVITPSVGGTLGGGGWYTSDVTVAWSVADEESEFTASGCDTQTVTSDTSGTTFTCEAASIGGTSSQSVTIKRDTAGPAIASATASPGMLWPPNNTMVAITLTVDASDTGSSLTGCSIASVDSNEGGSAHEPDVALTGPLTLNLRAEREGKGSGRLYTAHISCTDAAGNASSSTATVTVPHDQGKGKGKK